MQAGFSVFIFVLLSSQDGFATKWHVDSEGVSHAPALYNGAFSTIAFLIGAVTSILSGWLGMTIATYANARTALEARKGIAPAFMAGEMRFARPCDVIPHALSWLALAASVLLHLDAASNMSSLCWEPSCVLSCHLVSKAC